MDYLLPILAYIIGSIPFGLVVGKWGYGIDIREHGSGNLGGTNSFRTLGVKAGILVTLGDILKGTFAASLAVLFHSGLHPLFVGLFAVIGHTYPLFAKFKGGKAVATSAGVLLFYEPLLFLTLLACFFICLYITKYVSLSSMIAGIIAFIYTLFTGELILIIIVGFLAFFVIYRHRANLGRIRQGTEPKVTFFSKKK
ncbi:MULTISPECIES: glycerol-3-phosphate 1-O-acyltransferase PlsY [Priestia]|uniref:Glycerol-3-phosphate acyltransferase n=1 Tax=Priestia veravalensis TaxID=1414648 RepID=A0A0V8JQU2_9BACI|nr:MULTISPECIES: glycerol-3-phosphate 1-O-acyltransferase PlsY [Priestia]KSU89410.1 glycerol-3-phosphate acyltransferase [Priestia veravalensis]MCA1202633.1 glycerol-3-phosphate 1-O-acyltransferase PlsY [Priestia flexa]MEC0666446.1 glycerol-3-phosphate 1-O-acyltransferase PlsY [Priestia flexa]MED3822524.1 glycerol-3-phosphate 1-O-acyltransferase PlsY [Priestia flexa]SCB85796.1 glycerol-3-phosphate acyltransferase PlsY [Priestia flexa]